jgi:hypothetical protein
MDDEQERERRNKEERDRREAALFRVWHWMRTDEATHPEERYATVLHLRLTHPKAPIEELARRFAALVGSRVSPESFRKLLHRARHKFLELLKEAQG